jgi:hypothetical protein
MSRHKKLQALLIGTKVRIARCIDDSVPFENVSIGDTGIVVPAQHYFQDMISVKHDKDGHIDAYWPQELEQV